MDNKYTEQELCCAMMNDIIGQMDFKICIENGEFSLIDLQGAYLGDIDQDRFSDLDSLLGRMDVYINDYFIEDLYELIENKPVWELDKWDYTKTGLAFICSDKCSDLRATIDPEVYGNIQEKFSRIGRPSSKDIRLIIPVGMIFQEGIWSGQVVEEFYDTNEFRERLSTAFSSESIPKMVFDFTDDDLFFKVYSQSELEWEELHDVV